MAITAGANRDATISLIEQVISDSTQIRDTISDQLKTNIIDAISEAWYADEAVKFFQGFATAVEDASKGIATGINTVIGNIASTYDSWLYSTSTEGADITPLKDSGEYSEVSEEDTKISLDVSGITAVGPNSEIGIDEETASDVASAVATVRETIQNSLSELQKNLDSSAALIDGSGRQAGAIQTFYDAQLTAIEKIFDFLTEDDGENKSLVTCINESVTRYGETITEANATALENAATGETAN